MRQVTGRQVTSRVELPTSVTLHPPPVTFLLSGAVVFCVGFDVQADAGDSAVRAAAAGLLAVGTSDEWRVAGDKIRNSCSSTLNPQPLLLEKLPLFGLAVASCVVTIFAQHKAHPVVRAVFPSLAPGECRDLLCGLFGPDVLAVGSGGFIPVYGRGHWVFGSGAVTGTVGRHFRGRFYPASSSPLFFDRLAVVSHHAGAGDRDPSGRIAGAGGSLHVSAADWVVCVADLGGGGVVRRLASPPRGAGRRRHGHSGGFDFLRAGADGLLAQ